MLPAASILLLFLTYPLGLGIWMGFTDVRIGRPGIFIGLENYFSLFDDDVFWLSVFNTLVYTIVATVAKFGARAVAGASAQQGNSVQGVHPRHRAPALYRADRAFGDRLLVDLRSAVLDHLMVAAANWA